MILLDTNALLWLHQQHRRVRRLASATRLFASPSTILELQILAESGRLHLRPGFTPSTAVVDDRWAIDDIPAVRWFTMATEIGWTHDPFDRLIVAHARVRGWRLATSDTTIIEHLRPGEYFAL